MPAHRSSCFVVVRELLKDSGDDAFDAVVGVYFSLQRAEEVAGASAQQFRDAGVEEGLYRFTVKASNYYDE